MEIAKVIGIGIVGGILAVAVKKTNPELGMQVSIAAGVIVFCLVLGYLAQAVDFIRNFAEQYGALYQGTLVLLKVIGIAYLCEFGVQVLKDAGENALAVKVELAGKVIIFAVTLPLIGQFAQMVLELL
ncbi:SpoIIIAC/SpoIIIAD family protein [Christensenellaceae bacterium 44-20]